MRPKQFSSLIALAIVFLFGSCIPKNGVSTPDTATPQAISQVTPDILTPENLQQSDQENDQLIESFTQDNLIPDSDAITSHIKAQINFGPRIPGTQGSLHTAEYIKNQLLGYGWNVMFQEFQFEGVLIRNIIARNSDSRPKTIFGAHYDTRRYSDQEEADSMKKIPVPGANDGASGTALLIELGKILSNSTESYWLVFFDGEDQGYIEDWEWSVGAGYFAQHLEQNPDQVIIVDMIGDKDLNIFIEKNSDSDLCQAIWESSSQLKYQKYFIPEEKYAMIDDHLPFLEMGIPACLLIDFDYPYWHTNGDTLDKVSGINISIVGEVLLNWILNFE